mgnify:CR=1 FL=1
MAVKQIYDIVNSVNSQTMGVTDLTVVDEQGLISLGQTVLTTNGLADTWLNSLAQRIGRTIISFREYKSKYSDMVLIVCNGVTLFKKSKFLCLKLLRMKATL